MKLKYNGNEIRQTATDFKRAETEMKSIITMLDARMVSLQKTWEDIQEEDFHQIYNSWKQQVQGLTEMLSSVSKELTAIDKRYRDIDK
jgi:WXG100 family type VII secretion target